MSACSVGDAPWTLRGPGFNRAALDGAGHAEHARQKLRADQERSRRGIMMVRLLASAGVGAPAHATPPVAYGRPLTWHCCRPAREGIAVAARRNRDDTSGIVPACMSPAAER